MTKRLDEWGVRSKFSLALLHDRHRSAESMNPDGPHMRDITIQSQARAVECWFLAQVGMRSLIREHRKVFGLLQESINGARISEQWQKDVM